MAQRIYLSPPHLDGDEKELLTQAIDSNWITTLGPQVDAFEREICEKVRIGHAVALASGTAALHLALVLEGVKRGDDVLCSSFTFAASANAIVYCGANPVFIDSDRATWNMDPDLLEGELRACKKKGKLPKAAIVVDLYGQCADFDRILSICALYGVPVIDDAAEALGSTYHDKMAGALGDLGIFSFNGNKIITTSGGGMLVSNNKEYIDLARLLSTQAREPVPYYEHTRIGYNYRMSNLLAAVGRGQLQNLDRKVARKQEINRFYRSTLSEFPGVGFMPEPHYGTSNKWLTCITIEAAEFGASSEDIRIHLDSLSIESRNTWKPMHLQPIFKTCKAVGGAVSADIFQHGLALPSGTAMTSADLERVVDGLKNTPKRKRKYLPGMQSEIGTPAGGRVGLPALQKDSGRQYRRTNPNRDPHA